MIAQPTRRLAPARGRPVNPIEAETARLESLPGGRGYFPVVGIITGVMGIVFAIALVPHNPAVAGHLRNAALAMTACVLAAPLMAGFLNPRNLLRAENIIGMAPFYWLLLDPVQGTIEMPGITSEGARLTFVNIGVAQVAFWLGTMNPRWRMPDPFLYSASLRLPAGTVFGLVVMLFFLGMMSFAVPSGFDIPLMFSALGKGRWAAPWTRGDSGGMGAFVDHMVYFGYLLPTLTVMVGRRRGWLNVMTFSAVVLSLTFLAFQAQSGSRRIVGTTVGAALLYWILDRRKVKVQHMLVAILTIGGILWVMQVMLYAREKGFSESSSSAMTIATENLKGHDLGGGSFNRIHVDDNFYRLTQIGTVMPSPHPYVNFDYIFYVMLRPIPRVLWPSKPTSSMFALHFISGEGASLSSSMLGELYLSRGTLAIFLGCWLYGRLARLGAPLFYSQSGSVAPMIYGYMTMWLFVGYRSLIEVFLFSYPLLGWMLVTYLMRRKLAVLSEKPETGARARLA